jgi:drug/metabolite transporter (DMT)-like permease
VSLSPVGIGIAAALASATAYGINIVYARMATQQGVSAADLVFLRVFLMLGAVAVVVALRGRSLAVAPPARPAIIALGIASAGVGLAYFFAVSFVPIGIAAILFYTFPLLILLASPFVEGGRFTLRRFAVFGLAFTGLAIAIGPRLGDIDPRGLALAALASTLAAWQFFAAARAGRTLSPPVLMFWAHVVIMPIAGVAAFALGGIGWSAIAAAWFACAMTVAGYLVGFALQMVAARRAPAALIGLIFCLEPVVAIVFAGLILGETLTAAQMTGSLLVLAALVASSLAELRGEAASPMPLQRPSDAR